MIRRSSGKKVEVPVDKAAWHPSPLMGQIVLVSSRSVAGDVHVAAKSWISMVASEPPTLCLACRVSHRTAINILETREFVVNIPGEDLGTRVWEAAETLLPSSDGEGPPWSMSPSARVAVPRIQECRAHIECALDSSKRFNSEEVALFGRIVGVSIDEELLRGTPPERYRHMRPLIFLEEGLFGVVDGARRPED